MFNMTIEPENQLFAVVVDKKSTEIVKIKTHTSLSELNNEDVEELIERLAEITSDWIDVQKGLRCGAIFDPETGERLAFNTGDRSFKFVIGR